MAFLLASVDFFFRYQALVVPDVFQVGRLLGVVLVGSVGTVIAYFLANIASKHAFKNKYNVNVTYIVVFVFSFIGLGGYYLYHKAKSY